MFAGYLGVESASTRSLGRPGDQVRAYATVFSDPACRCRCGGLGRHVGASAGRTAGSSDTNDVPAAGGTLVLHDAPSPPRKFPTAADIPLGTLGSSILGQFGTPVARTTAVDENGKTELLIYHRKRPDSATVIHLRNGRVVATVTTAY